MQKLVLLSIVVATFVWPAVAVRRRQRPTFVGVLPKVALATAAYVALLLFVYPRLF